MSSACAKTRDFFLHGDLNLFEAVFNLYDHVMKMKAEKKSSKPDNVIKLDKWYQNELPKKIKSRGKDPHLIHDELVQVIKWKLARGKFRPNLANLVQMNTPRVVMTETKKAFRNIYKRDDLQAACSALCNLKGVGPAMASAVLAAGAPHIAPFMADECLLAMPDVDSLDYTMKEYMRFVELVNSTVERLNAQGGNWNPHKVELAIWTYYVANDLEPELLEDAKNGKTPNGTSSNENGAKKVENGSEDSNLSAGGDDSNLSSGAVAAATAYEDSNLSAAGAEDSMSSIAEDSNNSAPASNGNSNGSAVVEKHSSSNGSAENGSAAPAPEEEQTTNGGSSGDLSSHTHSSEVTASSNSSSSSNNPSTTDIVESIAKLPTVTAAAEESSCAIVEAETDTNDSTKENKESSSSSSSAQKRPSPTPADDDDDEEEEEVEQPVSKKMKEDEAQVVTA